MISLLSTTPPSFSQSLPYTDDVLPTTATVFSASGEESVFLGTVNARDGFSSRVFQATPAWENLPPASDYPSGLVKSATYWWVELNGEWLPFPVKSAGNEAATYFSYYNSESQRSFAFAYLIGNGTQSEISISNPFRHRNIIVDIREVDPPHASVGAEISMASEDRIDFTFTTIPDKNQYAAYLILAATSRLIGGSNYVNINHGFDSTHIIRQFQVTDTHHVTGVWNSANQTVLSATLADASADAYRLNMAHTFSYWDFPDDNNPSEIEHSLNERNLVYTVIDKSTFEEVGIDVDFEHSNFLKGTFTSQPSAGEYEIFSIPVKSPMSEFQGTVNAASAFTIIDGEFIEAQ